MSLPARIEISHYDVKHLCSAPRVEFGNRRSHLAAAFAVCETSIGPGHGRQASPAAANESCPFCDSQARLERPIGDFARGNVRRSHETQPPVFECIGHEGIQDSTSC